MDPGRRFAQYLLDGKMASINTTSADSTKLPSKEEFLLLMESWFEILCDCNHFDGLRECTSTALDVFGEWKKDMFYCIAKLFSRKQIFDEAIGYFQMALTSSSDNGSGACDLDIREDMEQVYNRCIPRWHFRMINDRFRNEGFFKAIKKAVVNGCSNVVDIGTGSGILSLFAAANGAKTVLAFEVSKTLFDLATSVISDQKYDSCITVLNKMSTDHEIIFHNKQLELIVMEIFDCGLFGEGVLPALKHALSQDVSKAKPKVIPRSARLYAAMIECPEIRKHSRSRRSVIDIEMDSVSLLGKMDPGDALEQPYTTENLNYIKGSYRYLSDSVQVVDINFECLEDVDKLTKEEFFVNIPVTQDGKLDAIVAWFELQLDDEVILSSSPSAKSCWEQAVYHIQQEASEPLSEILVTKGSSIELKCCCSDQFLQIFIHRIHLLESDIAMKEGLCTSDVFYKKVNGDHSKNERDERDEQVISTTQASDSSLNAKAKITTENLIENKGEVSTTIGSECLKMLVDSEASNGAEDSAEEKMVYRHFTRDNYDLLYLQEAPEQPVNRNEPRNCACGTGGLCNINCKSPKTYLSVNRRKVARINDEIYCRHYKSAIARAVEMKSNSNGHTDILFICEDISLLPLLIADRDGVSIDVIFSNRDSLVFMKYVATENDIVLEKYRFLQFSLQEIVSIGKKYDIIISEIVEENGLIVQCLFHDIVLIRTFLLKTDGILIPDSLTMIGRVVYSPVIENDSFVKDPNVTLGYDIGKFLNDFQVSTQPDINMLNLPYDSLSDDFQALTIRLSEGSTEEEILQLKSQRPASLVVNIKEDGYLSAIGYWFKIHLVDGVDLSTEANVLTHWNQCFVIFKERQAVKAGSKINIDIVMNRGNVHITRCSVADR